MVEKMGERVRKKVKEFAEMLKKKGEEEMDMVVEELVKLCKRNKEDHLQSHWCSPAIDSHFCEPR